MYFDFSYDGYTAAMEYLEETEQDDLIENKVSTDGYTIIQLANHLKEKESIE